VLNGHNLLPQLNAKHSLNKRNCRIKTKVGGRGSNMAESGFCLVYALTFHDLSTARKASGWWDVGPAPNLPGHRRHCTKNGGGKLHGFERKKFLKKLINNS